MPVSCLSLQKTYVQVQNLYKILKYQINKNVSLTHLTNDRPNYRGLLLLSTFFVSCCMGLLYEARHLSFSVPRKITANVFYSTFTNVFYFCHVFAVFNDFTARCNARIASAVLAIAIPSVCPSVTCQYCVKTTARSTVQLVLLDSKMCLVL